MFSKSQIWTHSRVRQALRAEYLATQPEAQVRRLEELGLTIQYTQQGIAFRGVHPVQTAMGTMYNCVVDRRVMSRHNTALAAHVAWLQIMQKTPEAQEPSAEALALLEQDLSNFTNRLDWALGDVKSILKADPDRLSYIQLQAEKFLLGIQMECKQIKTALSQAEKIRHIELYKEKKAKKQKRPKGYVKDLHQHLHKRIDLPQEATPDGSEDIVAQLRAAQRATQAAERAKYQSWDLSAEEVDHDSQ